MLNGVAGFLIDYSLFEKHGNDNGRIRAKYIKDCLYDSPLYLLIVMLSVEFIIRVKGLY